MIRTIKKVVACAALMVASAAFAAGDIFEVIRCESAAPYADLTTPAYSESEPASSGAADIFFKVRLIDRIDTGTLSAVPWVLAPSTDTVNWLVEDRRFSVGVLPRGGEIVYAEFVNYGTFSSTPAGFTDLVFKYTPKPGDFALPLVLATTDGTPANLITSAGAMQIKFNDSFYTMKSGSDAGDSFIPSFGGLPAGYEALYGSDTVKGDTSLEAAGFYIKTVDFDSTTEDGYWRVVQETTTSTKYGNKELRLEVLKGMAEAVSDTERTFFVWTENEDVAYVKSVNGVDVTPDAAFLVDKATGATVTKHVGTVKIAGGSAVSTDYFEIYGVKSNETTKVVLSPWNGYLFSADNVRQDDIYTTTTVAVTSAPAPTLKISLSPTSAEATNTINADEAFVPQVTLTASIEPAFETAVTVNLLPSFSNTGDALDAGVTFDDYIRFSTSSDAADSLSGLVSNPSITIQPGATVVLYGIVLRSDAKVNTNLHRLKMTAEPDGLYDGLEVGTAAEVKLTSSGATVSSVIVGTTEVRNETASVENIISGNQNYIQITVSKDAVADIDGIYTIEVKTNANQIAWGELAKARRNSDGVLCLVDELGAVTTALPSLVYNVDEGTVQATQMRVISPVSGQPTAFTYTAGVTSGPNPTGGFWDAARENLLVTANEGDEIQFSGVVSNMTTTADYYAFLVPTNTSGDVTISKNLFDSFGQAFMICPDTDLTAEGNNTRGLAVELSGGIGTFKTSRTFKLMDGSNVDIDFKVVLTTTEKYDPARIVYTGTKSVTLNIKNVAPVASRIQMCDEDDKNFGYADDGAQFTSLVPPGSTRVFKLADVAGVDMELDLENAAAKTEWTVVYPSQMYRDDSVYTYTGSPTNTTSFLTQQFTASGDWGIKVRVQDKDGAWSDQISTTVRVIDDEDRYFYVDVDALTETTYEENKSIVETEAAGSDALKIKIGPRYWDYAYTGSITVRVDVASYAPAATKNKGNLDLTGQGNTIVATETSADGLTKSYFITFNNQGAKTLTINRNTLDGTPVSAEYGFMIKATVVSDIELPTSGQIASSFYYPGESTVFVENVAPNPTMPAENTSTNRWIVAGSSAAPLNWRVNDVNMDFSEVWPNNTSVSGVLVRVSGQNLVNPTNIYATAEMKSGSFQPDFGDNQGDGSVTIEFTDKDGDSGGSFTYYYYVRPSRFLETGANGPSGGDGGIPVSQLYANADGVGEGHTFALDAQYTRANNWVLSWNCGTMPSARVFAYPYKLTSPIDNGGLDGGNDKAIDKNGNGKANTPITSGNFYTYADAQGRDSFFYGWIIPTSSDGESTEGAAYEMHASPNYRGAASSTSVTLPSKLLEDESGYATTYVEAVFAKEWRATDNMGDINGDGIPDFFAVSKTYANGRLAEVDQEGGDLLNIAEANNDVAGEAAGDFFPTDQQLGAGGTLVPGAISGWATAGQAFTAALEIRGFHAGLNYGMFKVDAKEASDGWISDIDLSTAEKLALVRHAQANNSAAAAALLATYDEAQIDTWLTTDEQRNLAKTYIDSTWAGYKAGDATTWGFTVENRTDPTAGDTDNDGMADGYEYYFWYGATVGFGNDGTTIEGCRFDLADVESYEDAITSAEIAAIYNPRVKIDWTKQDTDADGLLDREEILIGSSPIQWDTDRDGRSDLFEVMYNFNPVSNEEANNVNVNPDGDFMAYQNLGICSVYVTDDGSMYALVEEVTDELDTETPGVFKASGYGFRLADTTFCGMYMPAVHNPEKLWQEVNYVDRLSLNVSLFHSQVYYWNGFDPRTAWYICSDHGDLGHRWLEQGVPLPSGTATSTTSFGALDEFRVMKWRYITGFGGASVANDLAQIAAEKKTVADVLSTLTTNPNVAFEGKTWGDDTVVWSRTEHGADTDGDGVPDGWELYVGVNPNIKYTIRGNGSDILYDPIYTGKQNNGPFADGLDLSTEFAGTDSTAPYAACETVFAHHPSNENGGIYQWYNKFFPTDPRNKDTDADGIADGSERGNWNETEMYFNRIVQTGDPTVSLANVTHYSVYGDPSDSGARCIKGAGGNPLTVDTDADGLPDPWERQFAGILFDGAEPQGVVIDNALHNDIIAALIGYFGANTPEGFHVLLGQDMTVADAVNNPLSTIDLDWDGDGLQNWQEYMVQAMRHLRYDDNVTPLLGWDAPTVDEEGNPLPAEWKAGADGMVKIDFATPMTPEAIEFMGTELGYTNFAAMATIYPGYLKMLGYFADPEKPWDRNFCDNGYKYMMPPQSVMFETVEQDLPAVDDDGNAIWQYEDGLGETVVFTNEYEYAYNWPIDDSRYFFQTSVTNGFIVVVSDDYATYDAFETTRAMETERKAVRKIVAANGYVSSDPRKWDSDNDGMDDYYEMYHGLNPILGSVQSPVYEITEVNGVPMTNTTYSIQDDYIARKYVGQIMAFKNAWTQGVALDPIDFDLIKYPWFAGLGACDADGDGLRNEDEALGVAMTDPLPQHTDPTPLWMTDSTVSTSTLGIESQVTVTQRITQVVLSNGIILPLDPPLVSTQDMIMTNDYINLVGGPSFTKLYYEAPWVWVTPGLYWPGNSLAQSDSAFAFEENEGYDTDNNWRSDSSELVKKTEPISDPLDFSDIPRRQSIWFGGDDDPGAAISYSAGTRPIHYKNADLLTQFTVEAWVRPEAVAGHDQYIVSRAANYGGWNLDNTNVVIRMNFAIGIDAAGKAFAEYENSTDMSTRVTDGVEIELGEWSHLAATYDGTALLLYVNGKRVAEDAEANLIPANGVTAAIQDPQSALADDWPVTGYTPLPVATIIGARAFGPGAFSADIAADAESWDEVATDFFAGSVAEVRVWNGARTREQIAGSLGKALTTEEIKNLRSRVYIGSASEDEAGTSELVSHYDFGTLPGAADPAFVQKVPAGFLDKSIALASKTVPELEDMTKVGWWSRLLANGLIGSKAYVSGHVVPWIENTVGHLPALDGTVKDSLFWSENMAGNTPAAFHGESTFEFRNTMNPYMFGYESSLDAIYKENKYKKLSALGAVFAAIRSRYEFDVYTTVSSTTDLVPVGSAFAKRLEEGWDDQGAENAWAITTDGTPDQLDGDPDDTGIPLWARAEYPEATAYWTALAKGLVLGGSLEGAFKNKVDTNADGMLDWWSQLYSVKGGAADDDDKDGLSNYTEYLLSEVFDLGAKFSPVTAFSNGKYDSDYFFKIGDVYAGEVFTDHDQMEDKWEASLGSRFTSRYLWDAKGVLADKDEDGWSAFSECRYNEFVSSIVAKDTTHMINAAEMPDYPIPTVMATIRYNGTQRLSTADATAAAATNTVVPLVVRAYRDSLTQSKGALYDAQWTIYPGMPVERVQNLGLWGERTVRGTLTPGNIDPSSLKVEFSSYSGNDIYVWWLYSEDLSTRYLMGGTYEEYLSYRDAYGAFGTTYYRNNEETPGRVDLAAGNSSWVTFERDNSITATSDATTENGYFCYEGERVGTINLVTGEYAIDLTPFGEAVLSGSTNGTTAVANSLVRILYSGTVPTMQTQKMTTYLGRADAGSLKEGANDFIAFYDLNSDGVYTPGEPFGYARNVQVGWYKPAFEIELTDYSPITQRMEFWTGESDRFVGPTNALSNTDKRFNVATNLQNMAFTVTNGRYTRFRVARWAVDGYPRNLAGIPSRIVASGWINALDYTAMTEREILKNGELDLDWENFDEIAEADVVDLLSLNVTNVAYIVVFGDEGDYDYERDSSTNTVAAFHSAITRRFDAERATATPAANSLSIVNSRPTFSWKITGESDWAKEFGSSYTVCRIRVRDSSNTEVYNSGNMRMPACDRNGVYSFTPPIYAGCELEVGESYTWQVSIMNSKFQSVAWSAATEFYVNTQQNSDEFGSINVCAKYFGPAKVLNGGDVIVEAFKTPDFTGMPEARAMITASAEKATVKSVGAEREANATLIGLPAGTYYVRAFIDSKKHGTQKSLQSWESWGYVCPRESAVNEWMFTPTAIKVGDKRGAGDLFTVYIEDVDTNQNGLPDAWEMANNNGSLDKTTETIDATVSGIIVNEELDGLLTDAEGDGSTAAGLAAHALSSVSNAGIAVLVLDIDPSGKKSYSAALYGTGTDTEATGTPTITGITFANGKLTITADVDATVTRGASSENASTTLYTASDDEGTAVLTARVLYKADLSEADWSDTGVATTVTVTKSGKVSTGEIDLTDFLGSKGNPAKMFFTIGIDE